MLVTGAQAEEVDPPMGRPTRLRLLAPVINLPLFGISEG